MCWPNQLNHWSCRCSTLVICLQCLTLYFLRKLGEGDAYPCRSSPCSKVATIRLQIHLLLKLLCILVSNPTENILAIEGNEIAINTFLSSFPSWNNKVDYPHFYFPFSSSFSEPPFSLWLAYPPGDRCKGTKYRENTGCNWEKELREAIFLQISKLSYQVTSPRLGWATFSTESNSCVQELRSRSK